jgi:MFS family permease
MPENPAVAAEETYGLYSYRWVVLASFMLVTAVTQIMWLNYAPITSETQKLMGMPGPPLSEFKIVLLALMFPLLYIPVSIPAGIIIDRKGYRYAVLIGAALTAGFGFLRLFAGNYPLVLIGMIGIAVGQPFVLNSITKMVSTWFPTEESATATGIATLSLFLGMIFTLALTPALLNAFGKHQLSSLRWIVLIYNLIAVAALVLFFLLAKKQPLKPPKRTEEELQAESAAIDWGSFRKIFALYDFRLLCIILFIGNGAFVGILQLLEKILKPKGIGTTTAGNIGAVMVLAGVVGCVVLPALSDKFMRRKPFLILAAVVALPTLFMIGALKGVPAIYINAVFAGFFIFAAFPLVLTLAEETTGHALTGTATAILLLLGNAGGVVLTLLMEVIKGSSETNNAGSFWAMFFLVVLFAIALVIALFLKEPRHGELAKV